MADYLKRDEVFLSYLGRHIVSTNRIASKLFFDGKETGHVLKKFEDAGWIRLHKRVAPGGYSFISLTEKGALKAGVPKERGNPSSNVIDKRLGLAFSCSYESAERRYLLESSEANLLLRSHDSISPNVNVLLRESGDGTGLFRVYWVENLSSAVEGLTNLYESFKADKSIAEALDDGVFGVAVLARTPKLCQQLRKRLQSTKEILGDDCMWFVGLAPGIHELGMAMNFVQESGSSMTVVETAGYSPL